MKDIADLIEEFCECTDGYKFYPDYSGRYMYGRTCVGIVTDEGMAKAMGDLGEFLHSRGIDNVTKVLGTPATYELGLKGILYFPYVSKG